MVSCIQSSTSFALNWKRVRKKKKKNERDKIAIPSRIKWPESSSATCLSLSQTTFNLVAHPPRSAMTMASGASRNYFLRANDGVIRAVGQVRKTQSHFGERLSCDIHRLQQTSSIDLFNWISFNISNLKEMQNKEGCTLCSLQRGNPRRIDCSLYLGLCRVSPVLKEKVKDIQMNLLPIDHLRDDTSKC